MLVNDFDTINSDIFSKNIAPTQVRTCLFQRLAVAIIFFWKSSQKVLVWSLDQEDTKCNRIDFGQNDYV
jgi:hypothetical protein